MRLWRFFDKLEDKIRAWLSHYPIFYGFYGGIGVVLFWRGVWHTADTIAAFFWSSLNGGTMDVYLSIWDGPISWLIGSAILLSCGLMVSEFIGNEIIISGLRGEKKLTEKTESEVRTETGAIAEVLERLDEMTSRINELEKEKKS